MKKLNRRDLIDIRKVFDIINRDILRDIIIRLPNLGSLTDLYGTMGCSFFVLSYYTITSLIYGCILTEEIEFLVLLNIT